MTEDPKPLTPTDLCPASTAVVNIHAALHCISQLPGAEEFLRRPGNTKQVVETVVALWISAESLYVEGCSDKSCSALMPRMHEIIETIARSAQDHAAIERVLRSIGIRPTRSGVA